MSLGHSDSRGNHVLRSEPAEASGTGITLREVLVDILACFVPGIVFSVTLCLLFALPGYLMARKLQEVFPPTNGIPRLNLEAYHNEILVFLILVSYLFGFLFYRRDPKDPDQASYERLWHEEIKKSVGDLKRKHWQATWGPRRKENDDTGGQEPEIIPKSVEEFLKIPWWKFLAIRQKAKQIATKKANEDRKNSVSCNSSQCEFPYINLRGYLEHRGYFHLANMVPWAAGEEKREFRKQSRSKNFINGLKIRLEFHYPTRCVAITKNEAHIRLMSSAWYMAGALDRASMYAFLFTVGTLLLSKEALTHLSNTDSYQEKVLLLAASLSVPMLTFAVSRWLRRSIEKFIHYQRVREAFFVLELAYVAFWDDAQLLRGVVSDGWIDNDRSRLGPFSEPEDTTKLSATPLSGPTHPLAPP